jgi:cell filamentation protein
MDKIEKLINQVDATMRFEGMELTQEHKKRLKKCYGNSKAYVQLEMELVQKYKERMIGNDVVHENDKDNCYLASTVLSNKLNIQHQNDYEVAECAIVSTAVAKTIDKGLKGTFDIEYLKLIHFQLFSSIFSWAGEFRKVNTAKTIPFCQTEYIESSLLLLLNDLKKEDYLFNTWEEKMAERLAYYLCELNVIHPFREGNGRVQRLFIGNLALANGYEIIYENISQRDMLEASKKSFTTCEPMTKIMKNNLHNLSTEEHIEQLKKIEMLDLYRKIKQSTIGN